MSWYKLIVGLGIVKVAVAATGATTTSIAPTRTNCPLYSLTPAIPSPTKSVCGIAGVLGKANNLNAYCGPYVKGLGEPEINDVNILCYRACARDPKCVSYSIDPAHSNCYTYGRSLTDMAFQPNPNKYHFFYNLRDCYNCTLPPPPARSACAVDAKPKSPKPTDYTCGALGNAPDRSKAIYADFIARNGFPATCYELCASWYDPVSVCESYVTDMPFDYFTTCYIFDKPLREVGFVQNPNGAFYGWNLHGCYNCNISYSPPPSCTPTESPVNIGVRNGNFQNTNYNSSSTRTILQEWNQYSYPVVANGTNGNKFVNLTAVQTGSESGQFSSPAISQIIYGLDQNSTSPGRFYNYSFDLAIPGSYRNTSVACNLTIPGNTYYNRLFVRDDDRRYNGTTLRPYGPYLVDASAGGDTTFDASCYNYEKPRKANATFWVDNFRITKNGRDVGF